MGDSPVAIVDLFSKREKRKRMQGQEDVYQYDTLPEAFRVQVMHLWHDALGGWRESDMYLGPGVHHAPNEWWQQLYKVYIREKGLVALVARRSDPCAQFREYFAQAPTEDALDVIELIFRFVDGYIRDMDQYERQHWRLANPDAVIAELNGRFREHGIGYEFVGGEIVRVDSKYVHAEAVKPALELLHGAGKAFAGPLQEFMSAHERYRKGEDKDAITWALKAFESTLKAICTERAWPFDPHKDTASRLLEIVFANHLVPAYLQNQFTSVRSALESGVPTVRNKTSGHGQGVAPTVVPGHMTRFALNLTASNIVFLIECHQALN
jgi:hypothetical protein